MKTHYIIFKERDKSSIAIDEKTYYTISSWLSDFKLGEFVEIEIDGKSRMINRREIKEVAPLTNEQKDMQGETIYIEEHFVLRKPNGPIYLKRRMKLVKDGPDQEIERWYVGYKEGKEWLIKDGQDKLDEYVKNTIGV